MSNLVKYKFLNILMSLYYFYSLTVILPKHTMIHMYVALNFFFIVALENMSSQLTIEGIAWYCGGKIKLSYLYF